MKRLLLIILFLSAIGQAQLSSTGSITASGTTCATTNACIVLPLSNTPTVSTTAATTVITGTFSGTLQFESSTDGVTFASLVGTPSAGGSGVTSTTGTGTWSFNVQAYAVFRVRASAFASGTAVVTIQAATGGIGVSASASNVFTGASTFNAPASFASGNLLPSVAGGTDIGSTALPFGNLWLGTAATNNFKFQPAATAAARIIQIADPGATSGLLLGGTNLTFSPTAPTIAGAGCGGTVAAISAPNGTASFNIFTGTAPTSGGCTITMPTATTSWHCIADQVSAVSTTNFIIKQTGALSTTSVTLQLFSDVAAATAPAASDTWRVTCTAN